MATPDLRKTAQQLGQLWRGWSRTRRLAVAGAALATLAIAGAVATRGSTERWAMLFANLPEEDAAKVIEQLKAANVPHRLVPPGNSIEVPEARVHEQRIALAANGALRGGGVGFELFDKQSFGTTSFVEQMNYRRALQGELARTIQALDAVERARVHVAMPERSIFADADEPPTASVALRLRPGRRLSAAQVRGVVQLVAASVEGLRADRVTIVDESGATLWAGDEAEGAEGQRDLERTLARRVSELVESMVGKGRSRVAVTAELDHGRDERTEDLYDKDRTALRSESRSEDSTGAGSDATTGGVAGARGNLPGAPAPSTGGAAGGGGRRVSETKNFEVSHVVRKVVGAKGRLKRLSVAVVVDHLPGVGGKPGAPRSAEELARIAAVVKTAAGLDADRGDRVEVQTAPFAHEQADSTDDAKAPARPMWAQPPLLIGAGAALLTILVAAVALARRRRKRAQKGAEEATLLPTLPASLKQLEDALAGGATRSDGLAAKEGDAGRALPAAESPRDRAQLAARRDPAQAARLLAGWLAEGSAKPAAAGATTPTAAAAATEGKQTGDRKEAGA